MKFTATLPHTEGVLYVFELKKKKFSHDQEWAEEKKLPL